LVGSKVSFEQANKMNFADGAWPINPFMMFSLSSSMQLFLADKDTARAV